MICILYSTISILGIIYPFQQGYLGKKDNLFTVWLFFFGLFNIFELDIYFSYLILSPVAESAFQQFDNASLPRLVYYMNFGGYSRWKFAF